MRQSYYFWAFYEEEDEDEELEEEDEEELEDDEDIYLFFFTTALSFFIVFEGFAGLLTISGFDLVGNYCFWCDGFNGLSSSSLFLYYFVEIVPYFNFDGCITPILFFLYILSFFESIFDTFSLYV